jgi:hypothetical protein
MMLKSHPPISNRLTLLDTMMVSTFDRFEQQPNLRTRFSLRLAALAPGNKLPNSPSKKSMTALIEARFSWRRKEKTHRYY